MPPPDESRHTQDLTKAQPFENVISKMLCPYCAARDADSRDHIFSDFLGGRAWTPACKYCNSKFGAEFEATALRHLKDLMFLLRRSGLHPPKPMEWKGMAIGAGGERYDVRHDFKAAPSKPSIDRDATGRITAARGSRKQIQQIAKSLEREGRSVRITADRFTTVDLQQFRIGFPMDDDIKRLCIKMAVAAPTRLGRATPLGMRARNYLLDGTVGEVCPVRIAVDHYLELDQHRPRAGHLIYTRVNSSERRAYAVVQIFTAIQFYCELDDDCHGAGWAALATHDPISHKETFDLVSPLEYSLPSLYVTGTFEARMHDRLKLLRRELVDLYGNQAPLSFSPMQGDPK